MPHATASKSATMNSDHVPSMAKCNVCGFVHSIVRQGTVRDTPAWARWQRWQKCFRCGAPSAGFLPVLRREIPMAATLKPVVVPDNFGRGPVSDHLHESGERHDGTGSLGT